MSQRTAGAGRIRPLRRLAVVVAATVALVVPPLVVATPASANGLTITGTITYPAGVDLLMSSGFIFPSGFSGSPTVSVTPTGNPLVSTYVISGLNNGSGLLWFTSPFNDALAQQYWNGQPGGSLGSGGALPVAAGSTGINFVIERAGKITGSIAYPDGYSAATSGAGFLSVSPVDSPSTNLSVQVDLDSVTGDVTYRAIGLPTGDYILRYQPPYAAGPPLLTWQYWDGGLTRAEADPIAVVAGSATTADFSIIGSDISTRRVAGADRFETSVRLADAFDPASVDVVYLANGLNYPDALSAAPAAAVQGAPMLLTAPGFLPASVAAKLEDLDPSRVVIVGGQPSVSDAVMATIATILPGATIERQGGVDRFDTSRIVSQSAFGGSGATVAYITNGLNFPDALSSASAAAVLGGPVVLVNGRATTVEAETITMLENLGVDTIYVTGDANSVSAEIEEQLTGAFGSVQRLSGSNRFDTSVAVNGSAFTSATTVYLASGLNFPDALAGGALAGVEGAPLLISRHECIPESVMAWIVRSGATEVVLIGGEPSLSGGVEYLITC